MSTEYEPWRSMLACFPSSGSRRMYKFFRQTTKPCCAFKSMAAGRVSNAGAAFKLAFESIKPADFVCVGMCLRIPGEVE